MDVTFWYNAWKHHVVHHKCIQFLSLKVEKVISHFSSSNSAVSLGSLSLPDFISLKRWRFFCFGKSLSRKRWGGHLPAGRQMTTWLRGFPLIQEYQPGFPGSASNLQWAWFSRIQNSLSEIAVLSRSEILHAFSWKALRIMLSGVWSLRERFL